MNGFICPFCKHTVAKTHDTVSTHSIDFLQSSNNHTARGPMAGGVTVTPYLIRVEFHKCPNCEKQSIVVRGSGQEVQNINRWIYPNSTAKQYPSYVPAQIRSDYEAAFAISSLSPKASATLARRCLQGMIRDFWNVHDKGNLYNEIDAIKDKISPSAYRALDATRKIGNIGAHMEQDVDEIIDIDPSEAETLLRLIEHLMQEWYVNRHDSEVLLDEIANISAEKEALKKEE